MRREFNIRPNLVLCCNLRNTTSPVSHTPHILVLSHVHRKKRYRKALEDAQKKEVATRDAAAGVEPDIHTTLYLGDTANASEEDTFGNPEPLPTLSVVLKTIWEERPQQR